MRCATCAKGERGGCDDPGDYAQACGESGHGGSTFPGDHAADPNHAVIGGGLIVHAVSPHYALPYDLS